MKQFLYLIEADLSSGASKCALELILHLKKKDYRPIVITQQKNDFNDFCNQHNIENYHIHYARICSLGMNFIGWLIAYFLRPFLNYIALKKLEKKIDFSSIQFIHSNGSSIDFGAYLHKKKNIPHIWHVRDFFLFNGKWTPLVNNFPAYMESNSTYIVTVSNALRNLLIEQNVSPDKVLNIYDGIETSQPCRKETDENILNVVCVGQICKAKGQDILFEAIAKMSVSERKHFKFDFYGDIVSNEKKYFEKKIKDLCIGEYVNFKGLSDNILSILRFYDIGVQPSHSEGFSRVTAEYMMSELCVIAAEEGAIPELIQNKENGFLYKDYSSNELKDLLLFCFKRQDIMRNFAHQARKKATKSYNLASNLNNIISLYNKIN